MKSHLIAIILVGLPSVNSRAGCFSPEPVISNFELISSEAVKPKCIDNSSLSGIGSIETDQCKVTYKDKATGKTYQALALEKVCKSKVGKLTLVSACCSDLAGPSTYCLNYRPHQSELDIRSDDYACSLGIPYLARPTQKDDKDLVKEARREAAEFEAARAKRRGEIEIKKSPAGTVNSSQPSYQPKR